MSFNMIHDKIRQRQSEVSKSGRDWEIFVRDFVNERLNQLGSSLKVIKGDVIPKESVLWKKLALPVGLKLSERIWGDIDLVVISKNEKPLVVISCKTSLHGRFSETLFYAVVLKRLIKNLKVIFATPDKGRQAKKGIWSSEWGSKEKPTKDRLLGSHYLDGIYVHNPRTKLGGMIKSLEELPKDLIKWFER